MRADLQILLTSDALLLGRKTYEGFAAAWPTMKGTGEFGGSIVILEYQPKRS